MSAILPANLGDVTFASSARDDGSRSLEDVIFIADLASGALAEVLSVLSVDYRASGGPRFHLPKALSRKAAPVFDWYVETHHPLKRLTVVFDSEDERFCTWSTNFGDSTQRKECYDWTGDFLDMLAQDQVSASGLPAIAAADCQERLLNALNLLRESRLVYNVASVSVRK